MKWFIFFILMCSSWFSFGRSSAESDTLEVQRLIESGTKLKWIDAYESLKLADQALLLSRQLGYRKGMALANNLRGFCYWSFGDNDLAIEVALEALEIGEALKDPFLQAESYYILARGYMDLREQAKSDEYIIRAEALATQVNNWEQLCSIYNLRGVIKFVEGQRDSAHYYYSKALEIGRAHGVASINFPRILSNIGECYEDNPDLAFTYFNEALLLAKETSNRIAEASITDIIGHAYLRANDLKNAELHLQAALALARSLGLRRVIRHAYAGLVDIKLKQKRGDEAVVYLQQYYAVRDSLLSSSKIRQIVELESRHALQLKEQQVQLLEAENRIQTIWKNLMIGLVVSLTLISIAVYLLQRYRYRKNRDMLNLEIDYLTRQQQETLTKFKDQLAHDSDEALESHDQKLLKMAIAVVERHISDPQFGVEGLAGELNMSRTNLHRKIKSITGFPPSELIRSIRLRKAARLIARKVDSPTQVALLVGFDDYSHFSKAFKKHFGVPPSGYLHKAEPSAELHA